MNNRLIPIYNTRGDADAFLVYPHIYSRQGEWIGWVTADRKVYSIHGQYVGTFSKDSRILRRMSDSFDQERLKPPAAPPLHITLPSHAPLAPLMAELPFGVIDVLLEQPELLPPVGSGEGLVDLD